MGKKLSILVNVWNELRRMCTQLFLDEVFYKQQVNSADQGTFLVAQWLRLWAPSSGGPGLIPGQWTRSHTPQLSVHMLELKIPRATVKTWHSQINKSDVLKNPIWSSVSNQQEKWPLATGKWYKGMGGRGKRLFLCVPVLLALLYCKKSSVNIPAVLTVLQACFTFFLYMRV